MHSRFLAWTSIVIICLSLPAFQHSAFAQEEVVYPIEAHGLSQDEACKLAKSLINEGDLVFLEINNYIFQNIARLSASWTSHVGVILKNPGGDWVVAESTIPRSKITPFCTYVGRTRGSRLAIRRLYRPLMASELNLLVSATSQRLGVSYDTGFDYNSNKQFCSKFVYQAYLDATGLEIGRKETFADLRTAHPEIDITFAEVWFMGNIPWDRVTVTPASQYEDGDLFTVLESY